MASVKRKSLSSEEGFFLAAVPGRCLSLALLTVPHSQKPLPVKGEEGGLAGEAQLERRIYVMLDRACRLRT